MSNSTPRAALPPLPAPHQHRFPYTGVVQQFYTAEQVEQIRRETVQACAQVAMGYGDSEIEAAILALLPVKEPGDA